MTFATKLDTEIPFIGRDALLRQRDGGPKKRLFVLTVDDPDDFPLGNEPILRGGDVVGQLTSAAFGHTIGRAVALGYIRLDGQAAKDLAGASGFALELAGDEVSVSVSLRAPYDPQGERMRR